MDQFYNYHGEICEDLTFKKNETSYETYYQFKHAKARNFKKIQMLYELRALADEDLVGGKK